MHCFRELYEEAVQYDGESLYADVLAPRLDAARGLLAPLRHAATLRDAPPMSMPDEALFELFALSVLNDHLLLPLRLSGGEYRGFFAALGLEPFEPQGLFDPLGCEIVGVGESPRPEDGITLGACYWPGLRFGELIFSRCAVDVFCHPAHGIIRGIADRSTLHFANRRMRRECHDLSHGWGSNSRWGTRFARNYASAGYAFLNVDAQDDIGDPNPPDRVLEAMPLEAARELLLHRCLVRPWEGQADFREPYWFRMAIKHARPLWPLDAAQVVPFAAALRAAGIVG